MSKTIIVAVNPDWMDQFHHLPNRFLHAQDLETTVVIHHSPIMKINGHRIDKNFDLLITSNLREEKAPIHHRWEELLNESSCVVLKRDSKLIQQMKMNQTAAESQLSMFQPVATYYSSVGYTKPHHLGAGHPPTVVVKPLHGARGLGQAVLNTTLTNLNTFMQDRRSMYMDQLRERYPDVKFSKIPDNDDGEYLNLLRGEALIQEYIPCINEEYRLLVNPNGKIYVTKREREAGVDFPQATGVTFQFRENRYTLLKDTPALAVIAQDIELLIKRLNFTYGSMDLFVTEDGHWGFFEYCNQFGTTAYLPSEMQDFHQEAIEHWTLPLLNRP